MDDDYDILKKPDRISVRVEPTKDWLATKEREKAIEQISQRHPARLMHEKISPPTVPLGRDQSIFETHSGRASHRLVCCKSFPSDSDMLHWKARLSTPLRTAERPANMRHFENKATRECLPSWEC